VAGSVVAYCLGITDVDPLKYGLLFERFINPTGLFNLQIDIDFEYCELQRIVDYLKQKYGDNQVAQMIDMNHLAQKSAIIKVGKGLTFDIIGLCILTVMKECLKKIEHKYGIDDMKSIINPPKDDEKTFRLFQEGNTKGVFLFESDSMRKNLKRLQPSTFEELVALNAICCPKKMDLMKKYIKRKHNLEAITYHHPIIEKYLKETYGVTIYQEQMMLLSQEIAHFTPAESDVLARGVCCRRMTSAEVTLKEKFINGGVENGFDKDTLEIIWSDWMKNGCYLSNKSHAVCYTWLTYKTAYLKVHYPEEFMQAYFTINDKAI
jgi:DNA polymerase-3 subunit alpha